MSFDQRPAGVHVDLAARTAAEDALSSIENVQGGMGDDVLLGDDGDQKFDESGGIDTVDGRRGDDTVYGAVRVSGGAGDDVLFAMGALSLACGTGVDVVALLARLAPADCEWVYGDSDVVLGRNVLRVRGGLALRARLGGGPGQEIRLRADGVLVGRAR